MFVLFFGPLKFQQFFLFWCPKSYLISRIPVWKEHHQVPFTIQRYGLWRLRWSQNFKMSTFLLTTHWRPLKSEVRTLKIHLWLHLTILKIKAEQNSKKNKDLFIFIYFSIWYSIDRNGEIQTLKILIRNIKKS